MFSGEGRRKCFIPSWLLLALAVCSRYGDNLARLMSLIYFQTPLVALQAAMPLKDMATSTAAFGFLRYVVLVDFVASVAKLVI
jgi:hypothetical protein